MLISVINFISKFDEEVMIEYQLELETPGIWFFAEGSFDPDDLAELIHEILCEFSLPPCGFEWVNSCTKPQLDSFSGGAVWITTKGFEWLSTNNWLEEHRAKNDLSNQSS